MATEVALGPDGRFWKKTVNEVSLRLPSLACDNVMKMANRDNNKDSLVLQISTAFVIDGSVVFSNQDEMKGTGEEKQM